MAVFRGTGRMKNGWHALQQKIRNSRSLSLNLRIYSIPIAVTAIAFAAIGGTAALGHQYVQANSVDYYRVMLEGKPVGEISSKDKVEQLLSAKEDELRKADTPVLAALDEDQVSYEPERAYKIETDDEATLANLEGMLKVHAVGVKIVVDGKDVGTVRDQKTADELLQRIKNKFAPQPTAKKSVPEVQSLSAKTTATAKAEATPKRTVTSVKFVEDIDTQEVAIGGTPPSDPDKLFEKLTTGNPAPIKYTVKEGDCVGCIAVKLGVSMDLIYEKNPWIEDDEIHVGDELDLTALTPLINVETVEQVTQVEPIEAAIEYEKSDDMRAGQTKVLRQGTDGQRQVTYRLVKRNGSTIEEEIVSQHVLKPAVSTLILKGTKVIVGEGTGKFAWPVIGHRITSYQGSRWGRMHKGIDIIGKSNILAADNGVIEFAGYKSGGLGNAVIINHKNGYRTVYGHMKSVKVKKGQIVQKGDTIGIMGSTGRSTGTHLHFEIYLNGKLKNPTSYL